MVSKRGRIISSTKSRMQQQELWEQKDQKPVDQMQQQERGAAAVPSSGGSMPGTYLRKLRVPTAAEDAI